MPRLELACGELRWRNQVVRLSFIS